MMESCNLQGGCGLTVKFLFFPKINDRKHDIILIICRKIGCPPASRLHVFEGLTWVYI